MYICIYKTSGQVTSVYWLQTVSCGHFVQNHQAHKNRVRLKTKAFHFPYQKEKNWSISSDLAQQLAHPVPAAGVDLAPLVEGGRDWCKHDQVLLFQT